MAGAFTSCKPERENEPGEYDVEIKPAGLFGKWQAPSINSSATVPQYCVFLQDKDDTGEYYLGKTWDEGDDVFEEDLMYLGGGWFKWTLNAAELIEIHLMDNGGAEIPKYYTITDLTNMTLIYEDYAGKTFTWKKVK